MNNDCCHLAVGLSFVARVCTKVMITRVLVSCYNQWELASNLTMRYKNKLLIKANDTEQV